MLETQYATQITIPEGEVMKIYKNSLQGLSSLQGKCYYTVKSTNSNLSALRNSSSVIST
mgnify:CR=1 FL=1